MPIAKMRGATIKRVMSGFAGLALFIVVLNVTAFVIKYLWLGYLGQEGIKPSQETIHEARLLVVLAALLPRNRREQFPLSADFQAVNPEGRRRRDGTV